MGSRTTDDPAFASAIERAYLSELSSLEERKGLDIVAIHSDLMEHSIYKADRTHGGLRFKALAGASELETRLQRALSQRLDRRITEASDVVARD